MKLSYKHQLFVVVGLVVAVVLLIVFLLVVPQFRALGQIEDQIAEAEVGLSQAQTLLVQRQEIKARSAETEATRLRLANQIPEDPELPTLIVELQDTVNTAGLDFVSIAPAQPTPVEGQPFSEIAINVAVRGGWQDTVDLLQRLRALTRQVRIVSFSTIRIDPVTPDPAATEVEPAKNEVETSIVLEVYTMPQEVVPVLPDPAAVPLTPESAAP